MKWVSTIPSADGLSSAIVPSPLVGTHTPLTDGVCRRYRGDRGFHLVPRARPGQTAPTATYAKRGRLTDLQAQQIHAQLATLTAPAANERTTAIRIRQIQALAQLRQTGALSETDFKAEKARILSATPDQ
jgi:hypothetical protein